MKFLSWPSYVPCDKILNLRLPGLLLLVPQLNCYRLNAHLHTRTFLETTECQQQPQQSMWFRVNFQLYMRNNIEKWHFVWFSNAHAHVHNSFCLHTETCAHACGAMDVRAPTTRTFAATPLHIGWMLTFWPNSQQPQRASVCLHCCERATGLLYLCVSSFGVRVMRDYVISTVSWTESTVTAEAAKQWSVLFECAQYLISMHMLMSWRRLYCYYFSSKRRVRETIYD